MIYTFFRRCAHSQAASAKRSTAECSIVLALAIIIGLTCSFAVADEQAEAIHHSGAHEHGVAHLNVAVEGETLFIEFTSPAANIVGFEHRPETQEQKKAVAASIEALKGGESLFKLPSGAQSKLVRSIADTTIEKKRHTESGTLHNTGKNRDHAHDKGHGHDKAHAKEDHRAKEDHHGQEQDRHSDFRAEYRFICKRPDKLKKIDVRLFSLFPGIERIEVQLLTETKQTARKLTAKKHTIIF